MTNHLQLIATPRKTSNLDMAIEKTHRRYTQMINLRENWHGYLWQGRFASFLMGRRYLLKAAAYVERNPVKANMVSRPEDYRWSSVHAHLQGTDPLGVVNASKLLDLCGDWKDYLRQSEKNRRRILIIMPERVGLWVAQSLSKKPRSY